MWCVHPSAPGTSTKREIHDLTQKNIFAEKKNHTLFSPVKKNYLLKRKNVCESLAHPASPAQGIRFGVVEKKTRLSR